MPASPGMSACLGSPIRWTAHTRAASGKLLADPEWRFIIVLHRHDANEGERFAETRTGLDHVGFNVSSRADLERWQEHLAALGVSQSPIADTPYGYILVFRDPDNIQLEMFAPPEQ